MFLCGRSAILGIFFVLSATRLTSAADDATPDFNRDIRPILSENCYFCHGPDADNREADLRLDSRDEATEYAIVPGDPAASELLDRVFSEDPDLVMPPPGTGRALTDDQKSLLREWIAAGADYDVHWSFQPPVRPPVPEAASAPPADHPLDRFVNEAMVRRGLTAAPEADRETLIRRLSFDLTGLPPTPEEIDAFVEDTSPTAYHRLVDRLLASPRFGERMAADWLDVARYSDSYGMQVDRDRRVWPYRDWVIEAFNSGMGYDRFLTEQLAGDLLPDAGPSQILATAFNRLHPQECEGGSVPEEFRVEYVADRVQTTATAFLGLTFECCRCHDHKYDPLPQADYFRLMSFFDNIDEAGLYSYFTDACPTPTLTLFDDASRAQIDALTRAVDEREKELHETVEAGEEAFTRRSASSQSADMPAELGLPQPILHLDFEDTPLPKGAERVEGVTGNAVRLGGDHGVATEVGNFRRGQPFSIAMYVKVPAYRERAVIMHRSRAWTDAASRGYELLLEDGHLRASLIHFWPGNAVSVRAADPLPIDRWVHIAFTWDGSSRADGLNLYVDGKPAVQETVRDGLTRQITGGGGDSIVIGARFRDRGFSGGEVDEFKVFDCELSQLEVAELVRPGTIAELLQTGAAEGDDRRLRDFFHRRHDSRYAERLQQLSAARESLFAAYEAVPEIMVMRETDEPRQTYVLERGEYDAPGEPVEPGTPAVLPAWDDSLPVNRLGLARWMTAADHPLTSRVAANRLWQLIYGRGPVTTPEDFGNQGAAPTHPELLDWMAVELSQHDWDTKRMLHRIVSGSVYRRAAAAADPRDPENIYLAHSSRYRLPAEMLRDNALAVSGLLSEEIGGEPVRPYEVEESFKPVKRDTGKGLYRRSLYTYWNRTGPAPALTTLDASQRDVCSAKRETTATPLQALILLNSPQFNEAAVHTARRLIERHGDDGEQIIRDLFRLTVGRYPTDEERDVLAGLLQRQRERFAADPQAAARWLDVGDAPVEMPDDAAFAAAIASTANALLNFDGAVSRP